MDNRRISKIKKAILRDSELKSREGGYNSIVIENLEIILGNHQKRKIDITHAITIHHMIIMNAAVYQVQVI